MKKKIVNTIEDLFDISNGTARIAVALGVHQLSVQRWRKIGIPLKYWEQLIKLYNLDPATLYTITENQKRTKK